MKTPQMDALDVRIYDDPLALGKAAATDVARALRALLAQTEKRARILLAAAPSQEQTLKALAHEPGIDWARVDAFHLDEYVGLLEGAPQRFGSWLRTAFFDRVPLGSFELISASSDPELEAARYGALLDADGIDIALVGIGVNGHLAFNDPPADLEDPLTVRVVELDQACRQQQVDDGLFATVDEVPTSAITVTVPAILRVDRIFCLVSGVRKAPAVGAAIHGEISGIVPASALQLHRRVSIYLDDEAAMQI